MSAVAHPVRRRRRPWWVYTNPLRLARSVYRYWSRRGGAISREWLSFAVSAVMHAAAVVLLAILATSGGKENALISLNGSMTLRALPGEEEVAGGGGALLDEPDDVMAAIGPTAEFNISEPTAVLDPASFVPPPTEIGPKFVSLDLGRGRSNVKLDGVSGLEGSGTGKRGGRRAGPGLGDGTAKFMSTTVKGRKFVFIVDASASMSDGDRFTRARAELIRSVQELQSPQEYSVIFYNTDTYPLSADRLLLANGSNQERTLQWINFAVPRGQTDPLGALELAYRMKPDAIFLMTDGEFSNGFEIEAFLIKHRGARIPVHTISFVDRIGEAALREIAKITGGGYSHVD